MKKGLNKIESLERELNLKQLQINRLLNITQAINNNVSASGLFNMYKSFLSWEMGIKKMGLYIKMKDTWECTSSIGIGESLLEMDISDLLPNYTRLNNVLDSDHPLIKKFDVVIPVRHKDEAIAYVFIGGFGEDEDMFTKIQFITTITNIIAVAIENKRLFKRQIEQERLKREMELASDMQHMLIPARLPKGQLYELASIYKPHLGVGGDYFDAIRFEDKKLIFCVADISGKGLAAALLMANFQAHLHSLIANQPPLDIFVEKLNQAVYRITNGDRFITFFIAEFDESTRQLRYINAGHNPPYLSINGKMEMLTEGCTIIGSFPQIPSQVEVGTVQIDEEAMILTFTDGLTDLKNANGDFLNEQLLKDFLSNNYTLSAEDFNSQLMERIEAFKGDEVYTDDFTVLTCKIFQ